MPMRELLGARGMPLRQMIWLPYALATARQVDEALQAAATWASSHPNALTVIVYDGHAHELKSIRAQASQAYAQAWAFERDPELFSNEQLALALSRFALDGLTVVVNDCCYAAGFAVALTDAAREHPLPPWVMLSLVALPQATGLTGWEWTAELARLALQNPGATYSTLLDGTTTVDGVFASSPALLELPAFSLE